MAAYLVFRFFQLMFRLMPFRLMYLFSDVAAWFFNHVFRYRRKVVYGNLKRCFPEKNEEDIKKMAASFYLNFTDVFLESLKGLSLSKNELLKRYKMVWGEGSAKKENLPIRIIAAAGHIANWEWGVLSMAIYLPTHTVLGIYKEIVNKRIDTYLKRLRGQYGMILIPTYLTKKMVPKYADDMAIFLVGDQNPSHPKKGFWVDFFGQPVSALSGIELFSRNYQMPVYYFKIDRVKRGYYEIKAEMLVDNPEKYGEGEITAAYMKRVEAHIRENPGQWLWSHRRFKHQPPPGSTVVKAPIH